MAVSVESGPLFWNSLVLTVNQKEFDGALGEKAVRKITKKCQRIGFIDLRVLSGNDRYAQGRC